MNPFEEIKSRLSVLEVVESYIKVKRNGANYKACCPFHKEKSASLIISPSKEIWHCFGCGLGGDIFKFVMLHENISKAEALALLARQSGITLPKLEKQSVKGVENEISKEIIDKLTKGFEYLEWTSNLYHKILLSLLSDNENSVTKYCKTRSLDIDTIRKFKIGYAPTGDWLLGLAKQNKINLDLLEATSILRKTEKGEFKDKFSGRLMVPILDKYSRAVGFTARVIVEDSNRPKYLNSSQSDWFNKSEIWYGMNWNSGNIRKSGYAILVEGNMDVIKSSQYGLDNVIASQGTSFTTEQLQILRKITDKIQIAFDNDNAGVIASRKLFLESAKLGFEVFKVVIPTEFKDIDEMLSKGSSDKKLAEKLGGENPEPPKLEITNYLSYELSQNISSLISTDSTVQKSSILEFLSLLENVNPITRDQYINELSDITKISPTTLLSQIPRSFTPYKKQFAGEEEKNTPKFIIKNSKTQSSQNQTISAFYNVIIASKNINNLELLLTIFNILRQSIAEFQGYENYQELQKEKAPELDLINENNEDEYEIDLRHNLRVIEQYLDANVKSILMDSNLSTQYMEFKGIIQGVGK
jgi:DNA primase